LASTKGFGTRAGAEPLMLTVTETASEVTDFPDASVAFAV
jgi:hypothetical protein